jgi:hypothetical protein
LAGQSGDLPQGIENNWSRLEQTAQKLVDSSSLGETGPLSA